MLDLRNWVVVVFAIPVLLPFISTSFQEFNTSPELDIIWLLS